MKKSIFSYFSYLVLTLLAVGTLSSCDPTETVDAGPTITVNPETAEVEVGQTTNFVYQVVSDLKLDEVRIVYPGQADQVVTSFTNNTSYSSTYAFTGIAADAGKTITFTIEARDKESNVSRKSVSVAVKAAVVPVDPIAIDAFPAVLLGAQDNATVGSFLDANSGLVYKQADAKSNSAKIDMAYLQGSVSAGQGAVIGSPVDNSIAFVFNNATSGVQTWATKNATRFKDTALSEANFNAVTDGSQLTAAFAAGTQPNNDGTTIEGAKSRVNQLTAGKVFAFQTAAGKTGLVYVVSVAAGETGSIRLNVKVVK